MLIFVYGTLMSGFPLHGYLMGTKFIGDASIAAGVFKMVSLGEYPALVEGDGPTIHGELYEADDRMGLLETLDLVEHCPKHYKRKRVNVNVNGSVKTAWVYFYPEAIQCPEITSGRWADIHWW